MPVIGRANVIWRENHLLSKMLTAAVITSRFMPWFLPSTRIHCERLAGWVDRFLRDRPGKDRET